MKVKKKAKWIRKAMKEFREYEERVVEFKAGQTDSQAIDVLLYDQLCSIRYLKTFPPGLFYNYLNIRVVFRFFVSCPDYSHSDAFSNSKHSYTLSTEL